MATLGPASSEESVLRELLEVGVDLIRLNLSHGTQDEHRETISRVRRVALAVRRHVPIVLDLMGPRYRLGAIPGDRRVLVAGEIVRLGEAADGADLPVDDPAFLAHLAPGERVLIDAGLIELAIGKASKRAGSCSFLVGDMLALPFPDRSFDLVTTGYGLRNVPDLAVAIDEIARVLTPGGLALSLDFNRPANGLVRQAYLLYLTVVGGVLGWILHGDPDTYRYIAASIRRYPGAEAVGRMMEVRGFTDVTCLPVLGGLMAIHRAQKSG